MNKADAIKWAKEHKKAFARRLIRDAGVVKADSATAVFMAGLPGSGKTEFTKNLIANLGIVVLRLDMDEIVSQIETYTPQQADRFRAAASMLLDRTFDMVVHGGYDFIMDGTFSGNSVVRDVERALNHGYDVKIFYIYQRPRMAWEYTKAREKVEHRSIDEEGFVGSYYGTLDNLKKVGSLFGGRVVVDLVVKDDKNGIKRVENDINMKDIDKYVNIEYNRDKLRKSIYE